MQTGRIGGPRASKIWLYRLKGLERDQAREVFTYFRPDTRQKHKITSGRVSTSMDSYVPFIGCLSRLR